MKVSVATFSACVRTRWDNGSVMDCSRVTSLLSVFRVEAEVHPHCQTKPEVYLRQEGLECPSYALNWTW